jgi:hypothetical protein|tara:strand:- start:4602 stop:5141 length:540 start_codon:yes stop_codon:yes gene_type:complete
MNISDLEKNIVNNSSKKFPPVHLWNPDLCEGQDIRINREGEWFYNNSEIKNQRLIQLFSSVIKKEGNNYFLVTPSEKVPVIVELAPYVIINFDCLEDDVIKLDTNLNYSFYLDKINTTRLIKYNNTQIPLVHVRNSIEGFFNRSTYYKLVDFAINSNFIKGNTLFVPSGKHEHVIGKIA